MLYHILFIHSIVGVFLGYFHLLAIADNPAMNICVQILSPCFQLFWVYT